MFNQVAEKTSAQIILFGAPFATLFLMMSNVTDPVNATKLFITGGLGFALLLILIVFNLNSAFSEFKTYLILTFLFISAGLNSVVNSESPLSQNLYGSYGRNTGLVAYAALAFVSLGALNLRSVGSFKKIILGLQFAGLVNVLYCSWVLAFGDFLGWNNPYGKILGLFGNPDFISAFLGIFITTLIAFAVAPDASTKYRVTSIGISLVAFYEIVRSHAIQGIVVTLGGIAIVGFFAVRSYLNRSTLTILYVVSVLGIGFLGILGTLQKGPLSFVYKTSVSLRGVYWDAGLKMGLDHPLNGVGMDAYGDWYRRARSINAATVFPGPKTFTNASHNVVIDFFAYGGFPLLLSYLGMLSLAGIAVIKVIRRTQKFEPIFVAMLSAWVCYEVQSIISINQIGLAIWGWLLTGALIAYESATRNGSTQPTTEKVKIRKSDQPNGDLISPALVGGLGALVGFLIVVPPLSADIKWKSALSSQNAQAVMNSFNINYLNPGDSQRYAQAVQLFATNNLLEQAHAIAIKGIAYNSDQFDIWKMLYFLPNATEKEKSNALANMKRLDPYNPDVTAP